MAEATNAQRTDRESNSESNMCDSWKRNIEETMVANVIGFAF